MILLFEARHCMSPLRLCNTFGVLSLVATGIRGTLFSICRIILQDNMIKGSYDFKLLAS